MKRPAASTRGHAARPHLAHRGTTPGLPTNDGSFKAVERPGAGIELFASVETGAKKVAVGVSIAASFTRSFNWRSVLTRNPVEFCASVEAFLARRNPFDVRISQPHQITDVLPIRRARFLTAMTRTEEFACDAHQPRVLVLEIHCPDGTRRWVVNIPGTIPGTASGIRSDIQVMAGSRRALQPMSAAVITAMQDAGVGPDDDVMLAGHSLGGMVAADLASHSNSKAGLPSQIDRPTFNITSIVTYGSPIARYPVPASVEVLSFEHDSDIVPRLAMATNPDRPDWITHRVEDPSRDSGLRKVTRLGVAHNNDTYRSTISAFEDDQTGPAEAWRRRNERFLHGNARVTGFDLIRAVPEPSSNGITVSLTGTVAGAFGPTPPAAIA